MADTLIDENGYMQVYADGNDERIAIEAEEQALFQ